MLLPENTLVSLAGQKLLQEAARLALSDAVDREIAPVAGPHAKRLATAATVADAPLATRRVDLAVVIAERHRM